MQSSATEAAADVMATHYEMHSSNSVHRRSPGPSGYASLQTQQTRPASSKIVDPATPRKLSKQQPLQPSSLPRAQGESEPVPGPWDVNSLKMAILQANPGTGQIRQAIINTTFRPGPAAFTSLINMCAKLKRPAWEKALEIYDTLKYLQAQSNTKYLNTISYSSLISACGNAGRWEEALKVFSDMNEAALTDPECEPNAIAYSACISALEKGGQLGKALAVFEEMRQRGIEADMIVYSILIQACKKADEMEKAVEILEALHKAGLNATPAIYKPLITHLMHKRRDKGSLRTNAAMELSQPNVEEIQMALQSLGAPAGCPLENVLVRQHERIRQLEESVLEMQLFIQQREMLGRSAGGSGAYSAATNHHEASSPESSAVHSPKGSFMSYSPTPRGSAEFRRPYNAAAVMADFPPADFGGDSPSELSAETSGAGPPRSGGMGNHHIGSVPTNESPFAEFSKILSAMPPYA